MKLQYSSKLGWPLIIFFSFVPLIIWMITPYSLDQRFLRSGHFNYGMTMTAIGQVLGMVGMAMFALNLVLSARLKWLEGLFGGMNKVYIAHHILGGLAFVLLLLHPLFIVAKYIPNAAMQAVKMLFLLSPTWDVRFGVIALMLMILFLVLTFFVKLPYHIWKWTHKFMGLAFFFASLHVLLIPSDVTQVAILKYYMFFLVVLGFAAIFYRTVLGFYFVPKLEYVVEEIRTVNPSIIEIVMKPKDEKHCMRYTPGQFIFIGFPNNKGLEEVHPFSLSSQPEGVCISIGVKALGDYTAHVKELKAGDRAIIEGPFGRTSYKYYKTKEQIWVAGGIGITPFLGMARSLKPEDDYKVDLYYSAVSLPDAAFNDELVRIAETNPNFRLIPWYGKEKGFLSAEAIIKESGGVLGKEIFICGPPGMMKALKDQFGKWKVPVARVHSEEFSMN
jgi:predicted ferric reductase